MKRNLLILSMILFSATARGADTLPSDEAGAAAWFESHGARVTRDAEGHCLKLFHSGKPEFSVEELALIGKLVHLQELALNSAKAGDGDWDFMRQLPDLKTVRIWHGHHFAKLDSFAGIAAEDVLIGGCMGLRDLNKDDPDALRDAVLTLHGMPNLKKLSLYHSPLTPDDSHLAHLVKEFPHLTELRVDFAAPRGQEIRISPEGLRGLAKLKLTRFAVENSESLTPEHFAALAEIETLENLHIYPPREGEFDFEPLLAKFKARRPEVEITFQAKPGA
ncbi:MAG: hypothetical protein KDN19_01940 [Verrucomicrobiae bacterium]|nr:hypothetical protein [Verrucomicrobiae bacterium]